MRSALERLTSDAIAQILAALHLTKGAAICGGILGPNNNGDNTDVFVAAYEVCKSSTTSRRPVG